MIARTCDLQNPSRRAYFSRLPHRNPVMGCAESKPPMLFKYEKFFGVGRFIDNDIVYPIYMPRGGRRFFMGRVPKDIQPTNSLVALTDEWAAEQIYIQKYLHDYPVETGSTLILNAQYVFREDRAYSMIAIVYFCPTRKVYKTAWWYVTEILVARGEKIDTDD